MPAPTAATAGSVRYCSLSTMVTSRRPLYHKTQSAPSLPSSKLMRLMRFGLFPCGSRSTFPVLRENLSVSP